MTKLKILALGISLLSGANGAQAGVDGAISGEVLDPQGVALSGAEVKLESPAGDMIKRVLTSATGEYSFFPVTFGDYLIVVNVPDFNPTQESVQISAGANTHTDIRLATKGGSGEMVLKVEAKRHLIKPSEATSSTELTHEDIEALPQGNQISLPRLLETTAPGVVQGPFNQIFIRGNHANIQYQIDGVQLPDSTTGVFADAFSPRNIDHFETITGGVPAEYGERLAAVVNIVTKTGPEEPQGDVQLNYGTYNTFSPQLTFGGSTPSGDLHYYLSANYNRTDRGLDTPEPVSTAPADQASGGSDVVHDQSHGNNEFLKIDWLPSNEDKFSFIAFQNYSFYQIPNFPSSFSHSDPYFNPDAGFTDIYGNGNFLYAPPGTDDNQTNRDAYAQIVWKHTFSDKAFLQVAPYWKYSAIRVDNDPANDLASSVFNGPYFIADSAPDSFALDHHVNNVGLKLDYSVRPNDWNFLKAGFQIQASQANDDFFVTTQTTTAGGATTTNAFPGGGTDRGYFEAAYVQDDIRLTTPLSLNVGIRYTATQFVFDEVSPTAFQFQPRIGLNYLVTDETKLHLFYGRLFMPAPLENLREAFDQAGGVTTPTFYDIKPEKDNYFEFGVDQQIASQQLATVNVYYKNATDMLDDTQLLNTSIASPYNYANGYAYGVEATIKGRLTSNLTDYVNYSYEIAKGENISGGTFAVNPASIPRDTYLFLDHVQVHTANAGLTYSKDDYSGTLQGLYGSGLRTGSNNGEHLPGHFNLDLSAGYHLHGDSWWGRWKVSGDILNLFDNAYPITIANGFNGSHYAAGREFFIRLTKEL